MVSVMTVGQVLLAHVNIGWFRRKPEVGSGSGSGAGSGACRDPGITRHVLASILLLRAV